jgi:hypothetical protein
MSPVRQFAAVRRQFAGEVSVSVRQFAGAYISANWRAHTARSDQQEMEGQFAEEWTAQ